ncbi:MAG: phosphoribosyltransferase family protein [Candidatus Methanomethylicia archaeon]
MKLVREGNIIYDLELFNRHEVFRDRFDAGLKLAEACKMVFRDVDYVFAIPMGGAPIGLKISEALNAKFDLLICRKLLIPWNREAGFGAVDPDGNVFVDEDFAIQLGLSQQEIEASIKEQLDEIYRRNKILRCGRAYPNLNDKTVILVDDGIAAGYTMNAAIKFARKRGSKKIYIAVPTGCARSVIKISKLVDEILCLNLRDELFYAVADAYKFWRDLSDEDLKEILNKIVKE